MTTGARADVWNKKTILTVNQPIQVEDTYLEPDTYVFKLLDSQSDRHIVQIFNRDENRVIKTVLAIPNYRLEPTGDSRFMFYETPPGTARAMRAWFYPGDNYGQEFRYPKQLRQIAMLSTPKLINPPPEPPPPPVVTQPEQPEPAPVVNEPAVVDDTPKEIAQNTPPPAPPQAEPAPEPEPQKAAEPPAEPAREELPKTATPFPMIGLGGLVSLAAYGLIRLKKAA
jgi:hypothetical protein